MNENINLCEILKDCPIGTEFYSKVHGKVRLVYVYSSNVSSPIQIEFCNTCGNQVCDSFKINGKYKNDNGECLLVPSKDQQDWSKWECPKKSKKPKFDPKTLKPFDRVLVKNSCIDYWGCSFFSNHRKNESFPFLTCDANAVKYCIPYNDDTKHLVGTTDDAPEFYKYWED